MLQFLKKCKETISGFYYRISRGKGSNPTAILFMTSQMRYNLIRYGNIIFIDGQKRKYNKLESTLADLQGQSNFLKDAFAPKSKDK